MTLRRRPGERPVRTQRRPDKAPPARHIAARPRNQDKHEETDVTRAARDPPDRGRFMRVWPSRVSSPRTDGDGRAGAAPSAARFHMAKKMLIDATHPEETRVVVMDGSKVDEFDFESINKRQLAGNIYLAKVTRVEPSLQAAFVEYGGNRHGFLAFSEIHPDYYQIPVADREALLAAEAEAEAAAADDEDGEEQKKPKRTRSRSRSRKKKTDDAPAAEEAKAEDASTEAPETADTGDRPESAPEAPAETAEAPVAAEATTEAAPEGDETYAQTADANQPETTEENGPEEDEGGARTMAESAGAEEESVSEDLAEPAADRAAEEAPATEDGDAPADEASAEETAEEPAQEEKPKRSRTRSSRSRKKKTDEAPKDEEADDEAETPDAPESVGAEKVEDEVRPRRAPMRRYKIQEVIKVRQILLVQVVKEERGNKGAALTTYLSLAGRYCVLMPNTARGGGISRKITQAADRKKLKEIAGELEVPKGMGLIIRTAGARRTKTEIKRDYEFLLRQWEQIRELTLKSIAPALIYEEGSLIKRSIRDLYGRDIDSILVEGEDAYREAKDYMKMLMPSHAKNVQPYREQTPLFAKFNVESHLSAMFNPTVQLKSGGYIVIGITEALVAIDVNSGRSTREHSIEETALKTNLEAADEVARQLRLRDLAGLIVIDFIDMDENRNNRAVEKRMKDRLKDDRARIQVGRISAFGLMEMSRQRLRPGMLEATTAPCAHCHGTGIVRSADNVALAILREVEEEGVRRRVRQITVKAPVDIANYLINQKRGHIASIEERYEIEVLIEGDVTLISPDYKIEKVKGSGRPPRREEDPRTVSAETAFEEAEAEEVETTGDAGDDDEDGQQKKSKRRRGKRGGRKRKKTEGGPLDGEGDAPDAKVESSPLGDVIDTSDGEEDNLIVETTEQEVQKPKRKRPARRKKDEDPAEAEAEAAAEKYADAPAEDPAPVEEAAAEPEAEPEVEPEPVAAVTAEPEAETVSEPAPEPEPEPEPEPAPKPEKPKKKRFGWWS